VVPISLVPISLPRHQSLLRKLHTAYLLDLVKRRGQKNPPSHTYYIRTLLQASLVQPSVRLLATESALCQLLLLPRQGRYRMRNI
jgi:hypothetical protein